MKTRDFDTILDPINGSAPVVGSITFAPDKANPAHDPEKIVLQAEVERLRAGNRQLLDRINELQIQLGKYQ